MSGTDIERVRADLAAMRHAVGFELPFRRSDVWLSLGVAGAGAVTAAWTAFVPWGRWWGVVLPVAALATAFAVTTAFAQRAKHREPARWQEYSLSLLAAALLLPAAIGYLLWQESQGVSRQVTGGAAVLMIGVAAMLVGIADRTRRYYLVSGLVAMALGVAIPLCRPAQVPIAGGLGLFVIGVLTALIQEYQLEQHKLARRKPRSGGEEANHAPE